LFPEECKLATKSPRRWIALAPGKLRFLSLCQKAEERAMIVTSSSGSSSYTGYTDRSAKSGSDPFVLDENRKQESGNSQGNALTSGDTSFSAKLAAMFLVPERPESETGQDALEASADESAYSQYEQEFMDLADKTLAERIRDQYLKDNDLTEDEVNAMSPEDRKAVEDDIRNAILEAMGVNEDKQAIAVTINVPNATDVAAKNADDETALL
jgi:hypothetical protein